MLRRIFSRYSIKDVLYALYFGFIPLLLSRYSVAQPGIADSESVSVLLILHSPKAIFLFLLTAYVLLDSKKDIQEKLIGSISILRNLIFAIFIIGLLAYLLNPENLINLLIPTIIVNLDIALVAYAGKRRSYRFFTFFYFLFSTIGTFEVHFTSLADTNSLYSAAYFIFMIIGVDLYDFVVSTNQKRYENSRLIPLLPFLVTILAYFGYIFWIYNF